MVTACMRAAGACGRVSMQELCISYNCMSLRQAGRLTDIHAVLRRASVICLQGTRIRSDNQPINYSKLEGRHVFHAGSGPRSNKHAGVTISFDAAKHHRKHLTHVAWPLDPSLQGRGQAVRSRRRCSDITYICAYAPPASSAGNALGVTTKLYNWIAHVLSKLPSRTSPVLCMDASARTGVSKDGEVAVSESIGPCDAEIQNANGSIFKQFLERFHLVACDTMVSAGPTYFSGTFCTSSRIDYICVPQGWWSELAFRPHVLLHEGDKLQLVNCARRVDRRPVGVWLLTRNLQYGDEANEPLDRDALVRCVTAGEARDKLVVAVEQACLEERAGWDHALQTNNPTDLYDTLRRALDRAMRQVFSCSCTVPADVQLARQDRHQALQNRRNCRGDVLALTFPSRLLGKCMRVWLAQCRLDKACRAVKQACAKASQLQREQFRLELQQAWRKRRLAEAWKLCRRLAGVHKGSRRKCGRMPLTAMPSCHQWQQHLGQKAKEGGWAATEASKRLPWQGVDMQEHVIRRTHREQAMRDLRALSCCVVHGS